MRFWPGAAATASSTNGGSSAAAPAGPRRPALHLSRRRALRPRSIRTAGSSTVWACAIPATVYDLAAGSLREAVTEFLPRLRETRAADPAYLERCARCFLRGLCEQCPAKSWAEHGTLDTPVEYFCGVAHAQAVAAGLLEPGEKAWAVGDAAPTGEKEDRTMTEKIDLATGPTGPPTTSSSGRSRARSSSCRWPPASGTSRTSCSPSTRRPGRSGSGIDGSRPLADGRPRARRPNTRRPTGSVARRRRRLPPGALRPADDRGEGLTRMDADRRRVVPAATALEDGDPWPA
ncbi:MAG: hypothetical protein MZV64_49580 [Ignavibacteriales bacterium]|nr:hypothetical protein [Ignavibacteriales bacterium]